jgi:hypothetical protein
MKCRAGHESDENDFCSVCGDKMPSPVTAPIPAAAPTSRASTCPVCGEARSDLEARFCEVCRFDFVKGQAGGPPAARLSSPGFVPPSTTPIPMPPGPTWELVVTVDPSLDAEPDPDTPPPADEPERVFPVDRPEMLVGRRDDRQNIRPAVPLSDPGASRRHAKLIREIDGSLVMHDLASLNGTKLNGAEVVSGARRPLKDGDEILIGRWTRIKVRAPP